MNYVGAIELSVCTFRYVRSGDVNFIEGTESYGGTSNGSNIIMSGIVTAHADHNVIVSERIRLSITVPRYACVFLKLNIRLRVS